LKSLFKTGTPVTVGLKEKRKIPGEKRKGIFAGKKTRRKIRCGNLEKPRRRLVMNTPIGKPSRKKGKGGPRKKKYK